MRRVLLTIPDGLRLAAVLHTGVLARLAAQSGLQWLIASPLAVHQEFHQLLADLDVEIVDFPQTFPPFGSRQFELVRRELIKQRLDPVSQRVIWKRMPASARRRNLLHRTIAQLARWLPHADAALNGMQEWMPRERQLESGLDALRLDAVVLGGGTISFSDVETGRWARRRGLPLYSIIPSWDNLAFKGPTVRADRLAVWNESMVRDAVRLYGYRREQVDVVGPPAFDTYLRNAPASRTALMRKLGFDPRRRLILYSTMPPATYPHGQTFAHDLARMINQEQLVAPASLLVRLHPLDDPTRYQDCAALPNVRVEAPRQAGGATDWTQAVLHFVPTREAVNHLHDSLAASDVVVNIASTVTLEACALDRPVVNLAYRANGDAWPFELADYHQVAHYRPVVESGAVAVANSADELRLAVNRAIGNPADRREARGQLVRELITFTDGDCADRLATAVLRFVSANGQPRLKRRQHGSVTPAATVAR